MGSQAAQTIDERYLRRHLWGQPQRLHLRYPKEFGTEVQDELNRLLANPVQTYSSQPSVTTGNAGLLIENIHFRHIFELVFSLRTVKDVLWEVLERRVGGYGELKDAIERVKWELILPSASKLGIRVRSLQSRLFHESGIRDVVAAQLSAKGHTIVDLDDAECIVEFLVVENRLSILLSCLGRSGNERGFKTSLRAIAPMRSELAACLQERMQSFRNGTKGEGEYPRIESIRVPFAGSGTLAIEGILGLFHLPVGVFGREFLWESLPCAAKASNACVRTRMLERGAKTYNPIPLFLMDKDSIQVEALRENLESAHRLFEKNLGKGIPYTILEGEFDDAEFASKFPSSPFLSPLNPPFGERLSSNRSQLNQRMVRWLKNSWTTGSLGYLLSSRDAPAADLRPLGIEVHQNLLRTGGLAIRAQFFKG